MKTITLFLSLLILSCNAQKETTKSNNQQTVKKENSNNQSTQIELLTKGSHGGYETEKYLVIKNQKELQTIYTKINMMRRPGIPVPKIDFENEMVIALFMGQKNYGGHSISIKNIKENNNKTEIIVEETKPKGMATTVICQPFYFYKINRIDKEVIFKKVE